MGSVNQNQSTQVYLPHKDIKNILRVQGRNSDVAHLLTELMESIIRYQSCAVYEATRIRTKAVISRQSCKIDELLAKMEQSRIEARENTDRICGKLDNVQAQLTDKKEVVKNTYNKGIIIVQFLDESGYDIPEDKYLIYLHGGKRSYWNTYKTDSDKYYILYEFDNISDHDKAIRKLKNDMDIKPINPKRHLFALTEEQIDKLGEWFNSWQEMNTI